MMSIADLEKSLQRARLRLETAILALAPKHRGGEVEEFHAAQELVLKYERELASARGEEYAIPLEFPFKWNGGAPLPFLLQNDYKTFLTFFLREDDPNWDGTYVNVKDPGSEAVESLALVEFFGCCSAKLGSPNDEVLDGHPLAGKGMQGYSAQEVISSKWLAELEKINGVHLCYSPDDWSRSHHYIFWFHDSTFECIAESFKVETFRMNMKQLLEEVCQRLLG
ncbi:MAG: hypothetical protein K2X81_22750 [Candidatus Obscuribacterales bacterium]|nr:hypothetical protein [Candidatus Obscuribacterales bacterium]